MLSVCRLEAEGFRIQGVGFVGFRNSHVEHVDFRGSFAAQWQDSCCGNRPRRNSGGGNATVTDRTGSRERAVASFGAVLDAHRSRKPRCNMVTR